MAIVHFQIAKSMYVDKTTVTRKNGEKYTQYLLRTSKRQGKKTIKARPEKALQHIQRRAITLKIDAWVQCEVDERKITLQRMFANTPHVARRVNH